MKLNIMFYNSIQEFYFMMRNIILAQRRYILHTCTIQYLYSRSQKDCNIFFRWISECNLLIERLVLIHKSTNKNQLLHETIFPSKKRCWLFWSAIQVLRCTYMYAKYNDVARKKCWTLSHNQPCRNFIQNLELLFIIWHYPVRNSSSKRYVKTIYLFKELFLIKYLNTYISFAKHSQLESSEHV